MKPQKPQPIESGNRLLNITQAIEYGRKRGWPVTRDKINKALARGHLRTVKDTMANNRFTGCPMIYIFVSDLEFWVFNVLLIPYSDPMPLKSRSRVKGAAV